MTSITMDLFKSYSFCINMFNDSAFNHLFFTPSSLIYSLELHKCLGVIIIVLLIWSIVVAIVVFSDLLYLHHLCIPLHILSHCFSDFVL